MPNFTRVKPLGWALFDLLASSLMNALDTDHAKAVNGDDGSAHDGDVTLGSLLTNRTVTSTTDTISLRDVLGSRDIIATRSAEGSVSMAEKFQPRTVFSATYDSNVPDATTLDLTAFDTFFCTLIDGSGASATAALTSLTLTTAAGNVQHEIKKGAKFRIVWLTTNTGGAEVLTNLAYPATLRFRDNADKYLMLEATTDRCVWILEQVGTPGAPVFAVTVRRESA